MAKDWWKTFFDQDYVDFWTAGGLLSHTKAEVIFLLKATRTKKGQQVLDLCCGHGRHSIELARRGFRVTGLDYSSYELDLARKQAKDDGLEIDFRRGDARSFRLGKKFDLIINMFTAFGYGSEEDDRRVVRRVYKHLNPGGKFFIETQSLPWLWRNYKAFQKTRTGKLVRMGYRTFDFLKSVNHERVILQRGKRKKVSGHEIRMYSLRDLAKLLESENLKVIGYWGTQGEPYDLKTKRMLVLAKKI